MVREFSVDATVRALHDHLATHVLLVPTTINMIGNHPGIEAERFEHLQMVLYGASPIAPDVLRRAIDVFGCAFLQFFGMTETAGCTHAPPGRPRPRGPAGSAGVGRHRQHLVRDPRGRSRRRAVPAGRRRRDRHPRPGPDGRLLGPRRRRPAEALRNGWMHTGDLGYRNEEGYLFVTDRLKDMIVTGGENVYPREVEDVLFAHPAIFEAAVIGVPDERWGERVHAVSSPGRATTSARPSAGLLPREAGRLQVPEDGRARVLPAEERHRQGARTRAQPRALSLAEGGARRGLAEGHGAAQCAARSRKQRLSSASE